MREQLAVLRSGARIKDNELRVQCTEFLNLLQVATQAGNITDIQTPGFGRVRDMLGDISRSRGIQGFSPSETATFVFSMKRPLFSRIRKELETDAVGLPP